MGCDWFRDSRRSAPPCIAQKSCFAVRAPRKIISKSAYRAASIELRPGIDSSLTRALPEASVALIEPDLCRHRERSAAIQRSRRHAIEAPTERLAICWRGLDRWFASLRSQRRFHVTALRPPPADPPRRRPLGFGSFGFHEVDCALCRNAANAAAQAGSGSARRPSRGFRQSRHRQFLPDSPNASYSCPSVAAPKRGRGVKAFARRRLSSMRSGLTC